MNLDMTLPSLKKHYSYKWVNKYGSMLKYHTSVKPLKSRCQSVATVRALIKLFIVRKKDQMIDD